MKAPWDRDMHTYTFLAGCSLVLLMSIVLTGGLFLKQERKVTVSGSVHAGCYKWSDGTVTCQHGWRQLTDDQLYGCSVAQADPATGECR